MRTYIRIQRYLSRRDWVIVARHEMPGNRASRNPSRRVRYDRLAGASFCLGWYTKPGATDQTVPYGTDHVWRFSRHFMPGYPHAVPTGQKLPFPESTQMGSAPADRPQRYQ